MLQGGPFSSLAFGKWSFTDAQSMVDADGSCFPLTWEAESVGSFSAVSPVGKWSLKIEFTAGRAVISTQAVLTAPVRHLKYSLLRCCGLPLEHLVSGGMKMGSCKVVKTPVENEESFECFYNCTLSSSDSSLVISHPLKQSQIAKICGKVIGNFLDIDIVYQVDHFSDTVIDFPETVFEYGSPFEILESYAERNVEIKKEFKTPEYGWNTWDYYRWTISENEVLKNAEFIARDPVLSKHIRRIIVDDGWQYCYGEWYANHLFPSGMKFLASEIRKMGFVPGLWVAPSAVEPHARIAQLEYDMLAHSEGGQPCLAFQCMRRYGFILDPTVEKSRKFLRELFDRLTNDGYGYFKLDFLSSTLDAAQFADKSVPHSQVVRHLMQAICDGVANRAEILGCNYPFFTGNSYVDYVRVGSDIHATWHGAKENCLNTAYRYWMNKKLWLNDPDFALCRGVETCDSKETLQPCLVFCTPEAGYSDVYERTFASAKECELEVLLSVAMMAGGAINLSDDLTRLNEAGLDLARKVVSALPGEAAKPLDLFTSAMPAYWQQKLPGGGRALVVNWEDELKEFKVDFAGIPANVTDFWRGKKIPVPGEILLAPHSCLLMEW